MEVAKLADADHARVEAAGVEFYHDPNKGHANQVSQLLLRANARRGHCARTSLFRFSLVLESQVGVGAGSQAHWFLSCSHCRDDARWVV